MLKYPTYSQFEKLSEEGAAEWRLTQFLNRKLLINSPILLLITLIMFSCSQPVQEDQEKTGLNPAAEGFNREASDPKAIALADSVMEAMGGREAWDDMRYVSWNFFGARDLLWDKHTGRVRIDFSDGSRTYLVDIDDLTGKAWEDSVEITNPDTLSDRMTAARNIWINDSYWLFMPFKLKDSGVTLNYAGTDTMVNGDPAEVLKLTFNEVGVTPDNMYKVYISPEDNLVYQWAYYNKASQDSASAVWPWDNYKKYGGLMLSANRSDNRGPKDVKVYDQVDDKAFTSFDDPQLD